MFPTALVLHAFRAAMSHTEKLSALHAMQCPMPAGRLARLQADGAAVVPRRVAPVQTLAGPEPC